MSTATTSRIRLTKPVVATRADAEKILGELALATAKRNKCLAVMDELITQIRDEHGASIDYLAKEIEQKSGLLQAWAEGNAEEFGDRKSIEFLHGRIGFRTGTPKLKTLAGWTWDKVKGALVATFIRTKDEVDKEGLLAAHARGEIDDAGLRAAGVKVVQEEAFFVEPKLEDAS